MEDTMYRYPGSPFPDKTKSILGYLIAYLFALLFILAAISKLLHHGKFETQLAESPIFTYSSTSLGCTVRIFSSLLSIISETIFFG